MLTEINFKTISIFFYDKTYVDFFGGQRCVSEAEDKVLFHWS